MPETNDDVLDIMREYFTCRLELYRKRRDYMIHMLTAEETELSERARFISLKINGEIILGNIDNGDGPSLYFNVLIILALIILLFHHLTSNTTKNRE